MLIAKVSPTLTQAPLGVKHSSLSLLKQRIDKENQDCVKINDPTDYKIPMVAESHRSPAITLLKTVGSRLISTRPVVCRYFGGCSEAETTVGAECSL